MVETSDLAFGGGEIRYLQEQDNYAIITDFNSSGGQDISKVDRFHYGLHPITLRDPLSMMTLFQQGYTFQLRRRMAFMAILPFFRRGAQIHS